MVDEEPPAAEAEPAPDPGQDAGEPPAEPPGSDGELDEPDDDLLWPL